MSGFPGELVIFRAVDSEAVAEAVQEGAHEELRLRVAAADAAHVPRAVLGCQGIHLV